MTTTPFVLTPRMVASAALPLLIEGKLGGQLHPDAGCAYRHSVDRSPCVVGSALPDAIADRGDLPHGGMNVFALRSNGLIACSAEDFRTMHEWQRLHDCRAFDDLRIALEAELAKPEVLTS